MLYRKCRTIWKYTETYKHMELYRENVEKYISPVCQQFPARGPNKLFLLVLILYLHH